MAANTRRMVTSGGLEWRSDTEGVTLEGHASTFNQAYNMGWYEETVAPGAFTRTLNAKPDVRLLINHDGLPLARSTSGTLELSQDDSGLYMRSVLDPSDPDVQRIMPKMRRGDLDQMSFAFATVKDSWSEDRSQRTLQELSLANGDVSIVTYPANPNATASMRSRVLETVPAEKLRALYASIVEEREDKKLTKEDASSLRHMLETLSIPDDAADEVFGTLSGLLVVEEKAEEVLRTGIPASTRRARIAWELLRH